VLPVKTPGEIISATIKAITIKLFIPVYIVVNIIFIYFRGLSFLLDIYVAFLLIIITTLAMLSISKVDLPFTTNIAERNTNGNTLITFSVMLVGACLAGIHYLINSFNIPMIIPAIILTPICWFVFKTFRKIGWRKIEAFRV